MPISFIRYCILVVSETEPVFDIIISVAAVLVRVHNAHGRCYEAFFQVYKVTTYFNDETIGLIFRFTCSTDTLFHHCFSVQYNFILQTSYSRLCPPDTLFL